MLPTASPAVLIKAPSVESNHARTSNTLSPSAASSANAQTATVHKPSPPLALPIRAASSFAVRLNDFSTSRPTSLYVAKASAPHAKL